MSARDDLLQALAVERLTNPWWKAQPGRALAPILPDADAITDDELTTARRRREALAEFTAHERKHA